MRLDLSRFRKVHEDDKTATLKHHRGHKIVIAKDRLSKENKVALADLPIYMADAGMVPKIQDSSQGSSPATININVGGQGAQPTPSPMPQLPQNTPGPMPQSQPQRPMAQRMGAGLRQAVGDAAGAFTGIAQPVMDAGQNFAQGVSGEEMAQPEAPNVPRGTSQQGLLGGESSDTPQAPSDPMHYGDYLQNVQGGLNQQMKGIQGEAAANSMAGSQKAQALQDFINNNPNPGQMAQKISVKDPASGQMMQVEPQQWLLDQAQRLAHDIDNSHIDPKHYQDSLTTGGKIQTVIGLLLGGAGSFATGGRNLALDYHNKMIENDLESQKENLGKKQNLLSSITNFLPSLTEASKFFWATKKEQLANQLELAAANATSPAEAARAQQAIGKLRMESAGLVSQIQGLKTAASQPGGGMGGNQFANMIPTIFPKELHNEAIKQVTQAETDSAVRDNALDVFDQIANLNTVPNSVMNPVQTKRQLDAALDPLSYHLAKLMFGRATEADAKAAKAYFSKIGNNDKTNEINRGNLQKALESSMHYPLIESRGYRKKLAAPRKRAQ